MKHVTDLGAIAGAFLATGVGLVILDYNAAGYALLAMAVLLMLLTF